MPTIDSDVSLDQVEHIIASGTGILDFAIAGKSDYYTWRGSEDADWTVSGVDRVENDNEDRIIIFPQGDYFECEIAADGEEQNTGPVRCRSI